MRRRNEKLKEVGRNKGFRGEVRSAEERLKKSKIYLLIDEGHHRGK